MMRKIMLCMSLMMVAACQPPVPDSRAGGVGFDNYAEYQRYRLENERAQGAQPAPVQTVTGPVQNPIVPYDPNSAPSAAELAQAGVSGAAALAQPAAPEPAYPVVTGTEPVVQPVVPSNEPGISDEQDFSAVASRETIESDRARLEQNRAQYQQIQPTELPERTRTEGPDLIQYAITAPNRLGESIYKRGGISLSSSERACARYDTPEDAQQAFLKAGGPKRDSKNLDPDGDGFACFWDPTPFQKVRG